MKQALDAIWNDHSSLMPAPAEAGSADRPALPASRVRQPSRTVARELAQRRQNWVKVMC